MSSLFSSTPRLRRLMISAGAAALLVACTGVVSLAQGNAANTAGGIGLIDPAAATRSAIAAKRLGLSKCRVVPVSASVTPAGVVGVAASATISLELTPGAATTFTLMPYGLRSADYSIVLSDNTGDHTVPTQLLPAPTTYRGANAAGDEIWASIYEGQVTAVVLPAQNPTDPIYIQPESETIPSEFHAVFAASEVLPRVGTCGIDECIACQQAGSLSPDGFVPRGPGITCKYIRMNIDCDFPMYQQYSHDFAAIVRHVDAVMLAVCQLYTTVSPQTLPRFTVVMTTIRTTNAADPYNSVPATGGDVGTLLDLVVSTWPAAAASRDLTHLLTGRTTALNNGSPAVGVIGLGYAGVACGSFNCALAQNVFGDNIASAANLSAHEIGHNFNMQHDSSGSPYIMAPSVASPPNTLWSPTSMTAYTSYITSHASCGTAVVTDVEPDGASTLKNRPVRIDVLANDGRSGVICPSTVTSFTLPSATTALGGTVAVSTGTGPGGRNEVLYTPPTNIDGVIDTFNYLASGVTSPVVINVETPRPADGAVGATPGLVATYYNT